MHKSADILLIDDVQSLAEQERAQEEFFQIFNVLFQAGRQMVLTSDRPPREMTHLERRLRSRFGAGIIVDIQPPDLETRMAILGRELEDAGVELDDSLLKKIARRIDSNVRDLKGALNQVVARVRITREAPTPEMIEEIVERITGEA